MTRWWGRCGVEGGGGMNALCGEKKKTTAWMEYVVIYTRAGVDADEEGGV